MIYLISLIVFALDLLTKGWAISNLTFGVSQPVLPFFNLTLVGNRGVSFSMLTANEQWGVWLLILFTLIICGFIIYLIQKEKNTFSRVALAMVLGGGCR